MQYAEVALAVKTKDRQPTFTYRIPPNLLSDIQIGQRVVVPFYRRELTGTITALRPTPPKIRGSFKEIKSLVEPFPFFDRKNLAVAQQVAAYYGATIGQVLEDMAPRPAKRIAKKAESFQPQREASRTATIYGLYGPVPVRYNHYLSLINKAIKEKQSILILFTHQKLVQEFHEILREKGIESLIVPPSKDLSDYYQQWLTARRGEAQVALGTRKTIFLTMPRLRMMIIDSPSDFSYKEEQFPYYHAVTVGKIRSNEEGIHLVLGDAVPRLTEWLEHGDKKLRYLKPTASLPIEVTIVNSLTNRGILPDTVANRINIALGQKKRVAIFYNRRGSGRFYHCLDCETAIYCPNCDSLLTVYPNKDTVTLECPHCQYKTQPPYRCLVCQSYRLGSVGLGIDSVAEIIRQHFPTHAAKTLSASDDDDTQKAQITVATAEIFYAPVREKYDLLIALQADHLLHGSNWDTNEEAFITLARLAERTDELVIQTSNPEHPVIQHFLNHATDTLYEAELRNRKELSYPPADRLIRLTYSGNDQPKTAAAAEQLYLKYREVLPNGLETVLPPNPVGSGKLRGKYRYQIIIKSPLTRLILDNLPIDWQIDPDPIRLN